MRATPAASQPSCQLLKIPAGQIRHPNPSRLEAVSSLHAHAQDSTGRLPDLCRRDVVEVQAAPFLGPAVGDTALVLERRQWQQAACHSQSHGMAAAALKCPLPTLQAWSEPARSA